MSTTGMTPDYEQAASELRRLAELLHQHGRNDLLLRAIGVPLITNNAK